MSQTEAVNINILKTDDDGAFPCPRCGNVISPGDESEESYQILAVKKAEEGHIEAITVKCKCGKTVKLTGLAIAT